MKESTTKTLVLGLGNPIRSDDSVGLQVARALEGKFNPQEVTVMEASVVGGLDILELLTGYEQAIIIDAIQTGKGKAGQVYRFELGELDTTQHTTTPHGIDFATALEMGKKLGLALPQQITIFAIEVEDVDSFGESCTPEVTKAIPICARMIIQEINGNFKAKVA